MQLRLMQLSPVSWMPSKLRRGRMVYDTLGRVPLTIYMPRSNPDPMSYFRSLRLTGKPTQSFDQMGFSQ